MHFIVCFEEEQNQIAIGWGNSRSIYEGTPPWESLVKMSSCVVGGWRRKRFVQGPDDDWMMTSQEVFGDGPKIS
jgi:hypothetical protein